MEIRDRDPRPLIDVSAALRSGVSAIALCVLAISNPAYAQNTQSGATQPEEREEEATEAQDAPEAGETATDEGPAPADDAIIVTGIRQSLQNSQNIKRNADTVVDAITAQDIGALPDRSVTEALQRVPGVSINRFAGSNDPDHFSVEGSGVVVRGLSFVRSEFNGRDAFSTGVYGQAINFADVPAELLGSVEVYKNSTAEMIEGGLSGTVNLNLRRPFDNKGFHVGYDVEANYSDFAKKWSPVASILASNTWDTGIGRIGLLGALSYSRLFSRADGIQVTNFQLRNATYSNNNAPGAGTNICRAPLPSDTDQFGFPPVLPPAGQDSPCYGAAPPGPNGFADFLPLAYAPVGGQFRTQDYDRKRKGIGAAAQWESLDRRAFVTASFLRSHASQKWGEHTFETAPDLSEYNTFPVGCRPNTANPGDRPRAECPIGGFENYQYNDDMVFEKGFITQPTSGWRGSPINSGFGGQLVGDRIPAGGMQQSLSRRQVDDVNIVQDHGLNVKFTPNDRWAFNVDAQYVKAKHNNLDVSVFGSTFADEELDLTGELPVVIPHKPGTTGLWTGTTPQLRDATDEEYFTDPRYTFWRAAMDHIERSRGKEWAFRGDVAYNLKDDIRFLKRAKFGARYADRDQKIRFTTYNWGALSEVWQGNSPVFMDEAISSGNVEFFDFDNFFRGNTPGPIGGHYYSGNLIGDYEDSVGFFKQIAELWRSRGGSTGHWRPLNERAGVIEGTPFLPSDIQNVGEENKAGYGMVSFGEDQFFRGVSLEGNVGVRYVRTGVQSEGAIGVPSQQALGVTQPFAVRCAIPAPPAPQVPPGGVCNLGPEAYAALQQWATGQVLPDTAKHKYDYWLPSLNLKFGLTDEVILRFAASRNLARPAMADIRNFLTVGTDSSTGFRLTATAGNPFLKPALSDNLDLGLEWYFARVGSLTLNGFYKDIHNFFFQDVTARDIESSGVTQTVFVRGPANFEGKGKVRGFELAYQQTYDFLPGFLSGLGINANYTYIKSRGLPNSRLNLGSPTNTPPIGAIGNLPLEQLSKHNVNVGAFYEKGPVSLRAAYNWRSRFLLTSSDVIFPYFPIFNDDTGQLDASAFYTVTKNIKVGVQAVNLTDEVTKTLQQFTADGLLGPRSYFMNDRRFSFIVRGSF